MQNRTHLLRPFLSLLCFFLINGGLRAEEQPSLIAHWPLDGDYNDVSGNGHNGTVKGEPLTFEDGKHGQAIEFSGASTINCGNVPLGEKGTITVAFWAKPSLISKNFAGMVQKQNLTYTERAFWIGQHPTNGVVAWAFFAPPTEKGQQLKTPQPVLKNNEWIHIAMTHDGEFQRIFINGKEVAISEKRTSGIVDGGDILRFGRVENTPGGYYSGLLDDIFIYDEALSEEAITDLMNQSAKTSASELPVSEGLLLDLDANAGVELEEGNRVSAWHNQVADSELDVFVKRDEGRKKAGSGRPTLLESVDSIGGNNSLLFDRQELVNMKEDTCDHLLLGSGYTWISVMAIHDQAGGAKNVNAFFGNLRNSVPYDGMIASLHDDNRVWAHSRSTDITKKPGERFPKWKEKVRPQLESPEPIEEDRYYIVMGRMGEGEGTVDLELFINTTEAVATKPYTITKDTNASKLAIGQERDAITHPGKESFHGEITRFLIYERPLSDEELSQTIRYLSEFYKIKAD